MWPTLRDEGHAQGGIPGLMEVLSASAYDGRDQPAIIRAVEMLRVRVSEVRFRAEMARCPKIGEMALLPIRSLCANNRPPPRLL